MCRLTGARFIEAAWNSPGFRSRIIRVLIPVGRSVCPTLSPFARLCQFSRADAAPGPGSQGRMRLGWRCGAVPSAPL